MRFDVVTLFPESLSSYLGASIIGRAQEQGLISVRATNPRDFTSDAHRTVDDRPYGGGPGMILMAEPLLRTVDAIRGKRRGVRIVVLSAQGKTFDNTVAEEWATSKRDIILVAGRYEGIDARVTEALKAEEYSVGEYVLTGGELPALVIIDAITRRIPGVLGKSESIEEGRVASAKVYTRPETIIYKKKKYSVPEVLRGGHHRKIEAWQSEHRKYPARGE
ncbi:MAG: tRNA (guanosine(37)-N1)-methyltransferase TrmD [Candidatus Vogelbacteria bacterium]|nr:tRNA (guanosine(37)-N1)-methyltransferase TrmD [Candidatus Vogelbacteria bacterium]